MGGAAAAEVAAGDKSDGGGFKNNIHGEMVAKKGQDEENQN